MFRRDFLEILSVSSLGKLFVGGEEEQGSVDSMDVELLTVLPEDQSGEYTVRVADDSYETTGYCSGDNENSPSVVSGGTVDVRSNHGFVMAETGSIDVRSSFLYLEGLSKVVVDFREETVHLVYEDTEEDRYWSARKQSEFHDNRMKDLLDRAKTRGNGMGQEYWNQAKRHRELMYEHSKKAIKAIQS